MNIYYSFNDFMKQVINKADNISRQNHHLGIEELFNVSLTTLNAIMSLIGEGWPVFLAVVALFALGYIGFFAAITAFLLSPIGIVVALVLGAGAAKIIKIMYKERILPLAVRDVGEKYKSRWENADNNPYVIDNLLNDAANDLYQKAYRQAVALDIFH